MFRSRYRSRLVIACINGLNSNHIINAVLTLNPYAAGG